MDLTGWLEFFVQGLSVRMEEVKSRGTAIIRADILAQAHGLARIIHEGGDEQQPQAGRRVIGALRPGDEGWEPHHLVRLEVIRPGYSQFLVSATTRPDP